jgi:hypothetical protein
MGPLFTFHVLQKPKKDADKKTDEKDDVWDFPESVPLVIKRGIVTPYGYTLYFFFRFIHVVLEVNCVE